MKVCGIVAEYNPFHTGHLYHIRQSRALVCGAGEPCAVVAVMSGNYVQRGDLAVFDKRSRAEAAVVAPEGADLVLELPAPYACAGAERFATGAVAILDGCGVVTHLSFGSEAGELDGLREIADFLESGDIANELRHELGKGISFPEAHQAAVRSQIGDLADLLSAPNNILGVEYLCALKRAGSAIEPVTLKRKSVEHDGYYAEGEIASAAYIRKMIFGGQAYSAMRYIPKGAVEVFISEMARGMGPVNTGMASAIILGHLRRMRTPDYEKLPDISEGLHYRIMKAVGQAATVNEAARIAKTKRYTFARIKRILMNAFLGMDATMPATPPYIKVLAFNDRGRRVLRSMKKRSLLPVIVKPADIKTLDETARRVFEIEALSADLYRLAVPSEPLRAAGSDYTTSPVYIGKK